MKNLSKPVLYTPENITSLQPHEVFVFGSNIFGQHTGGAAAIAVKKFGAREGVSIGQEGQSYAIPTVGCELKDIAVFVNMFINHAAAHKDLTFYVTPIGCGSAGFTEKEIAPLFQQALQVKNIILPKCFVDILCHNQMELPRYLKTKLHGQFRTLVDVLIVLNRKYHYKSAEEAIRGLDVFYERFQREHNSISFHTVYRTLILYSDTIFQGGKLDLEQLEQLMSPLHFESIDKILQDYSIEKLMVLISYLNDFRRYTKVKDLQRDLRILLCDADPCGSSVGPSFFSFSPTYVWYFLTRYLENFWKELSKDGVLDNHALFDFMIGRHERGIRKYGLEAVVERNYRVDNPCHPDALFPYRGGAGPVYVHTPLITEKGTQPERRYLPACGNGMGPFAIRDAFEFSRVRRLLENDEKYEEIDDYFIPVADYTLPVYHRWFCRLQFASEKAKMDLITSLKTRTHDQ